MKMRGKNEEPKKMCPRCKADLETVVNDALGAKRTTHNYIYEECVVCREFKTKGRLVPKTGVKVNADGTGSFTGPLTGMGF